MPEACSPYIYKTIIKNGCRACLGCTNKLQQQIHRQLNDSPLVVVLNHLLDLNILIKLSITNLVLLGPFLLYYEEGVKVNHELITQLNDLSVFYISLLYQ